MNIQTTLLHTGTVCISHICFGLPCSGNYIRRLQYLLVTRCRADGIWESIWTIHHSLFASLLRLHLPLLQSLLAIVSRLRKHVIYSWTQNCAFEGIWSSSLGWSEFKPEYSCASFILIQWYLFWKNVKCRISKNCRACLSLPDQKSIYAFLFENRPTLLIMWRMPNGINRSG